MRALRTSVSILALSIAGAAMAADLPARRTAPVAPVVPVFTWTGFYAGINAGVAWNHGTLRTFDVDGVAVNLANIQGIRSSDSAGFTGGLQAGYNYQIGQFVLGAEADFNYVDVSRRVSGTVVDAGVTESLFAKAQVDWFGTVRARLGFTPAERLLVFATGGLAYGQVKSRFQYSADFDDPAVPDDSWTLRASDTRWGWTLGGGLEYAITDNLTLRGEYLYVDLGDKKSSAVYTGFDPAFTNDVIVVKNAAKFSVARAGLNYKF